MSCSITILSVSGVQNTSGGADVTISGQYEDCVGGIEVSIQCAGGQQTTTIQPGPGAGLQPWTANFKSTCNCGKNIVVNARCKHADGSICASADYSDVLDCESPCCPKIDVTWALGACNTYGQREVIFQVSVISPAGANCVDPLIIQGQYGDGNNGTKVVPVGQTTAFSLSHYYNVVTPSTSYTATFGVFYPTTWNCKQISVPVVVIPCICCPSNLDIKSQDLGCEMVASVPCRKMRFVVSGSFCANTVIEFDYGNGLTPGTQTAQLAGQQSFTFDEYYSGSGSYTVSVKVTQPTGCEGKSIVVEVPPCGDVTVDNPEKPKFCPCCIWVLLLWTLYFVGWALGWYSGKVIIPVVGTVGWFGPVSALFTAANLWIMFGCYAKHEKCKKCWMCRYLRCLMAALILSVIIALILLAFGVALPLWQAAAIGAIILFLTSLGLYLFLKCGVFFSTGKCEN